MSLAIKTRRCLLPLLAMIVMVSFQPSAAQADIFSREAVLKCSESTNEFIIRFGTLYNEAVENNDVTKTEFVPVSSFIQKKWDQLPFSEKNKCILSNGQSVAVHVGDSNNRPYGMGGANPDIHFMLKINDTDVYFGKRFYAGYNNDFFDIDSVYYDGTGLFEGVSS